MDNTTPNQPQNPDYPQYQQGPQYPQYQAPMPGYGQPPAGQPPARGSRVPQLKRWQWIAAGVGALVIVCCLCGTLVSAMNGGGASSAQTKAAASASGPTATTGPTATPKPTPTNTPTPTWTTVQTFSGNGSKKTQVFTVPDDWRIVWSCTPSSFYGSSYNVIVAVYNSDGSVADFGAVNTICKSGNTGDYTEEHSGGQVYLDVTSEGDWRLQVQVLK